MKYFLVIIFIRCFRVAVLEKAMKSEENKRTRIRSSQKASRHLDTNDRKQLERSWRRVGRRVANTESAHVINADNALDLH